MLDFLREPWPWYVAGPLITLTMLLIGYFGHSFGISSTLRTMCSALGASKISEFFDFEWKRDMWNLVFTAGAFVGGFIVSQWMINTHFVEISEATIKDLTALGVQINEGMVPENIFGWEQLFTLRGFILMVGGGFCVGFGTRYAGGCTSGHAITGLSNLQLPSLVAVIGFFLGGLVMTHLILPYILAL